ncbi:MAG: hypothetical protein ACXABY_01715 [Candidatus Thorarchaeota archaeon]|jgi:hypothetical protein
MAFDSTVIVGSGVSALREPQPLGQNVPRMRGSNTVVLNYEDVNSCLGISQSTAVAIPASATQLTPPAIRLRGRRKMIVRNLGPDDLFVGAANVSVSNGFPIEASGLLELDVLDVGDIYGVSNGNANARILELR